MYIYSYLKIHTNVVIFTTLFGIFREIYIFIYKSKYNFSTRNIIANLIYWFLLGVNAPILIIKFIILNCKKIEIKIKNFLQSK